MTKPKYLIALLDRGAVAESLFDAKILSMGLIISKPLNARSPYDRLVDCGTLVRVQIKCIWDSKGERGRLRMYLKRSNNESYSEKEVDVFAVYVLLHDCWYIFPSKGVRTKMVNDVYKERWDYIKGFQGGVQETQEGMGILEP